MSAPKYTHGEWVTFMDITRHIYTGHVRKVRGRWWFFGDVCRDIKGRVSVLESKGAKIQRHIL
jgi:hypothetical protein